MALSADVFDVGETLVDEAAAYVRWEAKGATTSGSLDELPEVLDRV